VSTRHRPSVNEASTWCQVDTQSSNYNLNDTLREAPPSSSFENSDVVACPLEEVFRNSERWVGEEEEIPSTTSDNPTAQQAGPDYRDIKAAILEAWPSFSATAVTKHIRIYGAAKTLEVVECAARLQKPDINVVLERPLMEWSAPVITEVEYTPALREGDEVYTPVPVPQRYFRSGSLTKSGLSTADALS
jgi:hypothetical protein